MEQLSLPDDKHKDWIQLKSYEMLKGKLKHLYDGKLEFKSDKLKTLTLDWKDIRQLRTAGVVSIGFSDLSSRSGQLTLINGEAFLDGENFDKKQLLTIIAGNEQETNYWSAKISLGANLKKGNNQQTDFNTQINARRRTTQSRLDLSYLGSYSRADGKESSNNHRLNGNFDWFISERFFLRPIFAEVYRDPFQNISYQVTLGSGLGYSILDTSKTEWNVSAGPAYAYTQFDNVAVGERSSEQGEALLLETLFETEISEEIDFRSLYRVIYTNEDKGGYNHHALVKLAIELTSILDLDLSVIWDRNNAPAANMNNVTPDPNDYQFIIGVGVDI
ncbi:DUF481 domain-containing protein [Shewanella algae]|uniref:DUF481 domain-containing protein n=1 Tax=Shewanella algae TaxID=38313 RepID=UPI001AACDAFB|nr:DUF481 domain-containing protein [Shewanella algae]MBO2674794.1 DUF481 domain-containing protein [Shewanella algae]